MKADTLVENAQSLTLLHRQCKSAAVRPPHAEEIRTYAELAEFVNAFISGHFRLLILIGGPGTAKSTTVRLALGDRTSCILKHHATPLALYCELYAHRNEPVVIDDCDPLFERDAGQRLLKSVCETDLVKSVEWHSKTPLLAGYPKQFQTSSPVCIIGNNWKTLNAHVEALEDRGHLLFFEPSAHEVHAQVSSWFEDREIFEFIGSHLAIIERPTMRLYAKAKERKDAGMDWRAFVLQHFLSGPALLCARLLADPSIPTQEERAKRFVEAGGGCRKTFFNYAKELKTRLNGQAKHSDRTPSDDATGSQIAD